MLGVRRLVKALRCRKGSGLGEMHPRRRIGRSGTERACIDVERISGSGRGVYTVQLYDEVHNCTTESGLEGGTTESGLAIRLSQGLRGAEQGWRSDDSWLAIVVPGCQHHAAYL